MLRNLRNLSKHQKQQQRHLMKNLAISLSAIFRRLSSFRSIARSKHKRVIRSEPRAREPVLKNTALAQVPKMRKTPQK